VLFAKNKPIQNEEWFPVVTEEGITIDKAPRNVCHDGKSKLLHPVVHLHLFNKSGYLFLQKRSLTKDIEPGKWDTSVGGHAGIGETIEEALAREIYEEVGIKNITPSFIIKYTWESVRERELVHSYYAISDETPITDSVEIDEGKFWSFDEIKEGIGKNIYTPNFEYEFDLINETLLNHFKLKDRI
jgi:isopentenyldiphosphate isomerase